MLRPMSDIENSPVDSEDQLQRALRDLSEHVTSNPALRLLLCVLADEPGEVASHRARDVLALSDVLDEEAEICRVAARLLLDYPNV